MKKGIRYSVLGFVILVIIVLARIFILENREEKPLTPVTIRLQWITQAQFAGYFIAKSKGFYEEEGLNVTIEEGGYSFSNIKSVQANLEEFGNRWVSDLVPYNKDFIILANVFKQTGMYLVSKKEKNIKNIQDLVGKRVSVWFIGNEYYLKAFFKHGNLPLDKIKIIPQRFDLTQFINNEVDVITVMNYNELLQLENFGYSRDKLNIIDFGNYKFNFMGDCIFTSREYYKNNPEICQQFVRATLKGWAYTIENPEESVDILIKSTKFQKLDYNFQLRELKECIKLIKYKQLPLGYVEENDINVVFESYKSLGLIDKNADYKGFFTNKLINQKEEKAE